MIATMTDKKAYNKAYKQIHKEELKEKRKIYYSKNRSTILEKAKKRKKKPLTPEQIEKKRHYNRMWMQKKREETAEVSQS